MVPTAVQPVALRVRIHGNLNDFLTPARRNTEFAQLAGSSSDTLKHILESLGIPHPEIGSVDLNGRSVQLTDRPAEGDLLEAFPYPEPLTPEPARFAADGHLGRLAAFLRMAGFDTWYDRTADDPTLASVAAAEDRILLTRDVGLLKRKEVERGYCLRSDRPLEQLREVIRRFGLQPEIRPFQRCMECNGELERVAKQEVEHLLPPHTRLTKHVFSRCRSCGKIYWRGSHHAAMLANLREFLEAGQVLGTASPDS